MTQKYRLFGGREFVISGGEDTIRLHLRHCLDKWEDVFCKEIRNKWEIANTSETKDKIYNLLREGRRKAFKAWEEELKIEDWYILWRDGEKINKTNALSFFLKDMYGK